MQKFMQVAGIPCYLELHLCQLWFCFLVPSMPKRNILISVISTVH